MILDVKAPRLLELHPSPLRPPCSQLPTHTSNRLCVRGGGSQDLRNLQCCQSNQESVQSLRLSDKKLKRAFLLATLLGAYVHNQCTRSLIVYAVNFSPSVADGKQYMNLALGFGPAQYAVMASYGFTALYGIASLFAGSVADKYDRKKTLALAVAVWSAALAAQGTICANFLSVFVCRVIQGFAMAFTGPQCMSLLAEYYPRSSLATALAIYTSGVYLGGALGSMSIISNAHWGWRLSFVAFAAVGLCISAVVLSSVEDPRTLAPAPAVVQVDKRGGMKEAIVDVYIAVSKVVSTRSVRLLLLAAALRFCAGYTIGCWSSPYFRARFPSYQPIFGLVNAAIIAGCGSASALLGGVIADYASARFPKHRNGAKMILSMTGCLLAIPAWILSVHAEHFWPAMLFLAIETLVAECWMGPALSLLTEAVPKEVRGTSQGMIAVLTMVGNAAPVVVGFLERKHPLKLLLVVVVSAAYAVSAFAFWLTALSLQSQESAQPS